MRCPPDSTFAPCRSVSARVRPRPQYGSTRSFARAALEILFTLAWLYFCAASLSEVAATALGRGRLLLDEHGAPTEHREALGAYAARESATLLNLGLTGAEIAFWLARTAARAAPLRSAPLLNLTLHRRPSDL